jgi:arginyl-tRNA synthetase
MNIEQLLKSATVEVFTTLFGSEVAESAVTVGLTKKEFEGDYTVVTFPLIKLSKKSPEETGIRYRRQIQCRKRLPQYQLYRQVLGGETAGVG